MGISLRLLFLAAFSWVGYVLYSEARIQAHLPEPNADKVVLLFAGAILDSVAVALILTLIVVPAVGDRVGSYFFNPSTKIEHDLHADAIARLAQGDPEGAIDIYGDILRKEPSDTLAISEIARICCRDLDDTPRAATYLERALDEEWPHEQSSFLVNRLTDVYLLQGDPLRARELLVTLATALEGTKYAANALHRIHEIDRSIETGGAAPTYFEQNDQETRPEPGPEYQVEDDAPSI